jgi:cyclic pyranopterin phosphate synthase
MVDVVGPHLLDAFGRRLQYLRLSVTERCNFRCAYCLPGGCPAGDGRKPLSVDEIDRLVRGFADLGFWKVRVTGGEPTLRRDIVGVVERVAAVPGVRQVGLTTNGYRLESLAGELARAGLTSLNVSVDSLDPDRFAAITGRSVLGQVVAGVDAAIAAGIPRIKVNAVLLAETGAGEIDRFLGWARDAPLTIRFIELMETGCAPALYARPRLPAAAIEQLLAARGWTRLPRAEGDGPAVDYGQAGHRGRIGIIAPTRKGFCLDCNRLRVSSAGDLKLCLFDDRAVPLRPLLRADAQRAPLREAIRCAVGSKPASHHLGEGRRSALATLSSLGG